MSFILLHFLHCLAIDGNGLTAHNHADKLLIVDVALLILHVGQKLFNFLVGELLTERGQQVAQLSGRYVATSILIEMAQALNEIVGCVAGARLRYGLIDGQKDLERDALVRLQLMGALLHIRFGGILAQCTQAFAHLAQLNFAIAAIIE